MDCKRKKPLLLEMGFTIIAKNMDYYRNENGRSHNASIFNRKASLLLNPVGSRKESHLL